MKRLLLFNVIALLLGCMTARAQTTITCLQKHPVDPGAVEAGRMTVTVGISSTSTAGTQPNSTTFTGTPTVGTATTSKGRKAMTSAAATDNSSGGGQIYIEVIVTKTSSGTFDYIFDPSTIKYSGIDCSAIDSISTLRLFDMIGQSIVAQGIQMGLTDCSPDCDNPTSITRVYSSSCVQRVGSGCNTRFYCCDNTSFCERNYVACCPDGVGSPIIKLLSVASSGCSTTARKSKCEPGCP